MNGTIRLLALLIASQLPFLGQVPTATASAAQTVRHLTDLHIGVERAVPPGWSIAVRPVALERQSNDSVAFQVHIVVTGVPPGTLFSEQVLPVESDVPTPPALSGISVGKGGILTCSGRSPDQCGSSDNLDDPVELGGSALRGEPYRFLFVSSAGTIGAVFVPYPVASKDGSCTLSAVRLTQRFELALITGTGFTPNSDVRYSATPGAKTEQTAKANSEGVIRFSLIPHAATGQTAGKIRIKIDEPQCSPAVTYDWGTK